MVPLLPAVERSEAMLRRRLGTVFRIADYSVRGYEVPLNKIIAELLDPRGSHGQEGAFLKLFLRQAAPDLSSLQIQDWMVAPSFRTRNGRYVDIALFNGQNAAIYIESKPWAEEGDQQLQDYAFDLDARSQEQRWLLFLPGMAGRVPETLTPELKRQLSSRLKIVPYQHCGDRPSIVRWLEECAEACEADNVRTFVRDLAKYLDDKFPNNSERNPVSDDPFTVAMLDSVLKNGHHMELVLRFERMAPEVRRTVARNFINELTRQLEAKNPHWRVENHFKNFTQKWEEYLAFSKAVWPKGWALGLSMESNNYGDFIIGFYCPSKRQHLIEEGLDAKTPLAQPEDVARIHELLANPLNAIGEGAKANPWWPAYCYLPSRPPLRNWDEPRTFLLLAGLENMPDGSTAVDKFVEWFQDLASKVEKCIDEIVSRRVRQIQ